jgi:hypothetical protein
MGDTDSDRVRCLIVLNKLLYALAGRVSKD